MMLPSIQSVEERVSPPLQSFHIQIALGSDKKSKFTSACMDPKTNHSVLSYDAWEALGWLILAPITYCFMKPITITKQCLGYVILIVTIIQDQPMSFTFYVVNMGQTIEDVPLD